MKLLQHLDKEEQQLIKDRFLHDKSFDDISSPQGITAVNARKRISRILQKLRGNRQK